MLPETLANDFGDSWRVESSCPDAVIPRNPCVINKHRAPWAHKMCSIIRSDVFKPCHEVVSPGPIVTQNKLIRLFRIGDQFFYISPEERGRGGVGIGGFKGGSHSFQGERRDQSSPTEHKGESEQIHCRLTANEAGRGRS